jgi:hypothetical protein
LFYLVFISTTKLKEENMIFNNEKFTNAVKSIHLKPEEFSTYESIPDSEVRTKLNGFIDYGENPRFSVALEEICENIVGRTMFRILMTKLMLRHKRMLLTHHDGDGSKYEESVVYVNLSFYKENGGGIPSRYYFYIDEKGEIKLKLKSLAGSIFHEFCHGLHDVSGTHISSKRNVLCVKDTPFKTTWSKDEELRTICCMEDAKHYLQDPICDHCFDFCQSILKKEKFSPRYSHGGYNGIGEPAKEELKDLYDCIPVSQKYMDGWRKYII